MRYALLVVLMLLLAPLLAQPVPFEQAMQAGDAADAHSQQMQALARYREAVTLAEAEPDHPEWLIASLLKYGDLTERAGNEGRSQQAATIFTRALTVAEKAYGKDDLRLVAPLTALGWQLWRLKQHAQAEARLTEALAITEKALPADAPQLADARFTLGGFYLNDDRDKAITCYRLALATYEKAYGPEHDRTLRTRLNLGKCLVQTQQYPEALEQFQPVYDVLKRTKPGSWALSEALMALSSVYIAQKQYTAAEPLELERFALAEKLMHAGGIVNSLQSMAKFYNDAGMPEKAQPYLLRVIATVTAQDTRPNYQVMARAHADYADLLVALNRPTDAAQSYRTAYDCYERFMAEITRTHVDTKEQLIPTFFHDQVPEYQKYVARYITFLRERGNTEDADRLVKRAEEVDALLQHSVEFSQHR